MKALIHSQFPGEEGGLCERCLYYRRERGGREGGTEGVPITSFTILTFEWLPPSLPPPLPYLPSHAPSLSPSRAPPLSVARDRAIFRDRGEKKGELGDLLLGFHFGSTAFLTEQKNGKRWGGGGKKGGLLCLPLPLTSLFGQLCAHQYTFR